MDQTGSKLNTTVSGVHGKPKWLELGDDDEWPNLAVCTVSISHTGSI